MCTTAMTWSCVRMALQCITGIHLVLPVLLITYIHTYCIPILPPSFLALLARPAALRGPLRRCCLVGWLAGWLLLQPNTVGSYVAYAKLPIYFAKLLFLSYINYQKFFSCFCFQSLTHHEFSMDGQFFSVNCMSC